MASQCYPNCDLVVNGKTSVEKDANGLLRISYSWDRKEGNYEKVGQSFSAFFVRYGPMEDGKIVEATENVVVIQKPVSKIFLFSDRKIFDDLYFSKLSTRSC